MEERDRVAEWKVTDAENTAKLLKSDRARDGVCALLRKLEAERNELTRQLAQTELTLTA